jgi:hypothetical protein
VLAADQRVTWWAKELKKAGLDGDMDQLRARAFLDIMLGRDSRDSRDFLGSGSADPATATRAGAATGAGMPPTAGAFPAGFAGRINLTIPLATQLDLAERPGELAGIGPVDPDPGANTLDRYQTGASVDSGIQRTAESLGPLTGRRRHILGQLLRVHRS